MMIRRLLCALLAFSLKIALRFADIVLKIISRGLQNDS